MHNNIMAAGSKDRPPMLGPGRYSQWRSRFLRYIDTKNNGEGLKKCILNGPYVPTSVLIQAVPEAEGRPTVLEMKYYSSVDEQATLANEILHLEMGESHGVVLLTLQPEWSRFVTLVKQSEKIDTISYHRLFDILKQFQKEVNDIRAERIAKSANPLALLAAAQPYSIPFIKHTKPQRIKCNIIFHKTKRHDPEQAQRDMKSKKNIGTLAKTKTVAGLGKTLGSHVVATDRYSALTAREYVHNAKGCRSQSGIKTTRNHKEKMMDVQTAEQGGSSSELVKPWLETDMKSLKNRT
ncbi:hypothetical protein Tco_0291957 [Tanacetum coccineum]